MLTSTPATAPDGAPYQLVTLHGTGGLKVTLSDWGACWLSAQLPLANGQLREALLGCPTVADWQRQTAYLGASVGRYANRIANSRFTVDGKTIQLAANQGVHQLHGGAQGFHQRRWQLAQHRDSQALFTLLSPDGDQGFPGALNASVTFSISADNRLIIDYQAGVSKPCPVNLCSHPYFNLDGIPIGSAATDIRQHRLQLAADSFLPVNGDGIPAAELQPVTGSSFDFRHGKKIGSDFLTDHWQRQVKGYDHGFLLTTAGDIRQPACIVDSADQQLQLRVYTTAPALQVYSGNYLHGTPARSGGIYQDWQGLALETGFLADSPNHQHWPQPDCIVRPATLYRSLTHYQFIAC